MPALDQPLRAPSGTTLAAGGPVAAGVVSLITAAGTVAARRGPWPGAAAERELSLPLVLLCLAALAAGPVVGWVARIDQPSVAVGLAVATAAVAAPLWAGWAWLPEELRALLLAAAPLAVAGVAHVGLGWRRATLGWALLAVWGLTVLAAGVHAVGYNPFADPFCDRTCADVPTALDGVLPTAAAGTIAVILVLAAAGIAAGAAAVRPGTAPAPVRLTVSTGAVLLAAAAVTRWSGMGGPRAGRAAVILAPLVIGLVAAGAGAALARTARTRAAVQLLIDQLTDAEEGTRAVPPSPLGSVHFAVPGEERWVDRDGTDVGPVVTGHPVVSLTDPAGSALRFVLSSATDAEGLLARVSPARRLMLSNARLTALTRARLADLRSSQRRAVARADAERLRIERDLHDGAQQRLVGAALHLSVAKTHADPSHQVLLDRAQEQVQQALARLRGITHGPFPPALADDGLAAALDELAEDSPVLVALHSVGDLQVADDVARAVYALIAAALADPPEAPDAAARITVACAEGVLRVDVQLDWAPGTPWDDTDVRDRVGAVGGTYVRARSARSTTITAVIPCGS